MKKTQVITAEEYTKMAAANAAARAAEQAKNKTSEKVVLTEQK